MHPCHTSSTSRDSDLDKDKYCFSCGKILINGYESLSGICNQCEPVEERRYQEHVYRQQWFSELAQRLDL